VAAILLGVVLIAVSVTGWLQANPVGRQLGLGVKVDPSLRAAALQLDKWRDEDLLDPREQLFNTTPDVASYLAWFCPSQKSFIDLRLSLFPEVADDFVAMRSALVQDPTPEPEPGSQRAFPWRSLFPKWNIRYLVVHLHDPRQDYSRAATRRLLTNPDGVPNEWTVCYLDGRVLIARWNGTRSPAEGQSPAPGTVDFARLAFAPDAATAPSSQPVAKLRPWWSVMWKHQPSRPADADEAYQQFYRYQIKREEWTERNMKAWQAALAASIVGVAARGRLLADGSLMLVHMDWPYRRLHAKAEQPDKTPVNQLDHLGEELMNEHLATQESGPVEALYLAVRAARRATAENPEDAETWFLLGQLYYHLAWRTGDLGHRQPYPQLALTRQAQATAALQRALMLDPDHERAHGLMSEWARRGMYLPVGPRSPGVLLLQGNLELELKHTRELLRCARVKPSSQDRRRLEMLHKQVAALEERVSQVRDKYELTSIGKSNIDKAEMALSGGLGETALNILRSPQDDLAPRGKRPAVLPPARFVELLISMGRIDEAREELLQPESRTALGLLPAPLSLHAHDWFDFQVAAASGDYEQADESLARILDVPLPGYLSPSGRLATTVGHLLLWDAPLATRMPGQLHRRMTYLFGWNSREAMLQAILQLSIGWLQHESDLLALRACLEVESGANTSALRHFSLVLERTQDRIAPPSEKSSQPEGKRTEKGDTGAVLFLRTRPLALKYIKLLEANQGKPGR
jgi:hypothetical protein